VRNRQVCAVAVDPILNMAPPMVAQMLVDLCVKTIIQILYPILLELLMMIFFPEDSVGMLGEIQGVPDSEFTFVALLFCVFLHHCVLAALLLLLLLLLLFWRGE
jgi:hypothetical protein